MRKHSGQHLMVFAWKLNNLAPEACGRIDVLRTQVVYSEALGMLAPQECQHLSCWVAEHACSSMNVLLALTYRLTGESEKSTVAANYARASPVAGKLIASIFGCSCKHVMSRPW